MATRSHSGRDSEIQALRERELTDALRAAGMPAVGIRQLPLDVKTLALKLELNLSRDILPAPVSRQLAAYLADLAGQTLPLRTLAQAGALALATWRNGGGLPLTRAQAAQTAAHRPGDAWVPTAAEQAQSRAVALRNLRRLNLAQSTAYDAIGRHPKAPGLSVVEERQRASQVDDVARRRGRPRSNESRD